MHLLSKSQSSHSRSSNCKIRLVIFKCKALILALYGSVMKTISFSNFTPQLKMLEVLWLGQYNLIHIFSKPYCRWGS